MTLIDIIKKISPFNLNLDLYNSCKELEVWKEMTDTLIYCLKRYKLHVGSVSGEANVLLYYYKIYNTIKELEHHVDKEENPPFCMVTGPIINVEEDNTSIIIEMFRERMVSLYNSYYRQAEHFRIGGWNYDVGIENKVYKEEPHSLSETGIARKPKLITDPEEKNKYYKRFQLLTTDLELLNPESSDINKEFIFLSNEDIKRVREQIKQLIERDGVDFYKPENEKELNKELIGKILNELKIQPRVYPDKTQKAWYSYL